MKKFYPIIGILLVFAVGIFIFALNRRDALPEGIYYADRISASDSFVEFVDGCFSEIDNMIINSSSGNDVSETAFPVIQQAYEDGDYVAIMQYMVDNHCNLGHFAITQSDDVSHRDITCKFYHCAADTTGKYVTEWSAMVTAGYTFDADTNTITEIDNPVANYWEAASNAEHPITVTEVSTPSGILSNKHNAFFSVRYPPKMVLTYPNENNEGIILEFGRYTDTVRVREY